jgi:Skp family chaperone for outer membrane proteins
MQRRRSPVLALVTAMLVGVAGSAGAQDAAPAGIVTIDQERLFVESEFGKSVREREMTAARALEAENARIEADLIAEEQALTERRAALTAEEFSALATAFDDKVVRIRSEQDAKVRDLARTRDEDRQEFFRTVVPVLGDLLVERNAVAIIDKAAIILSLTAIDVTDAAIAKVDATLKPGTEGDLSPGKSPDPAPDPAAPEGSDVAPPPAP